MSFDGVFTHAMVRELNQKLTTGRVTKVNHPYQNELVMTIRTNGHNYPLLLSANPTYARVQITDIPYVNPATPSNFAMMMRKYLSGAILTGVTQLENDRVVRLHLESRNELGDKQHLMLIVEIMARHSNVVLIDEDSHRIIDAIKRISSDQNRYRTLLPNGTYINPPKQETLNPFSLDTAPLADLMREFPNEDVLAKGLQQTYQGLGRDTAQALAKTLHRSENVTDGFKRFMAGFDDPQPTLAIFESGQTAFTAFPYPDDAIETKTAADLSTLLDQYFADRVERDRVNQQGGVLIRIVRNELKKARNKMKKLAQTMAETENADQERIKGEILTTYLSQITRGETSVELPNFYEDNAPIKIALSNQISPSQNAQKYFKRYQKLKNAVHYVTEQMALTQNDIDYFENIMSQIELAAPKDLTDIKTELQAGGYLRDVEHRKKNPKKNRRTPISKPEEFVSSDGALISVGKNNLQNEKLTLHTAKKTDIWLHVQKMPGSHVIIHEANPSGQTLLEAAQLAAYFSKARQSSQVPVDYLPVKKIRKPNGAKPGFVIFEGQSTMYVTPDATLLTKLRK